MALTKTQTGQLYKLLGDADRLESVIAEKTGGALSLVENVTDNLAGFLRQHQYKGK